MAPQNCGSDLSNLTVEGFQPPDEIFQTAGWNKTTEDPNPNVTKPIVVVNSIQYREVSWLDWTRDGIGGGGIGASERERLPRRYPGLDGSLNTEGA